MAILFHTIETPSIRFNEGTFGQFQTTRISTTVTFLLFTLFQFQSVARRTDSFAFWSRFIIMIPHFPLLSRSLTTITFLHPLPLRGPFPLRGRFFFKPNTKKARVAKKNSRSESPRSEMKKRADVTLEKEETKKKKEEYKWAWENESCQKAREKWRRPKGEMDTELGDIVFQQVDIKYVIEETHKTPSFCKSRTLEPVVPVIKMFGTSEHGQSIALSVYNFMPYFCVPLQEEVLPEKWPELCIAFHHALEKRMGQTVTNKKGLETVTFVDSVEMIEKMTIMNYQEKPTPFFKITFTSPKHIPPARTLLEGQGLDVQGLKWATYPPFEAAVLYVLRFMIDCGIGGASWVGLPKGKYIEILPEKRECHTDLELAISYEDLVAYAVDDEQWSHLAPLRILSFDIECAGRKGKFPEPSIDPVIQISNYVQVQGQEKPIIKNIMTLNTCDPIAGIDVRCYKTETELLQAWSQFVLESDPDMLTGYNIVTFDLWYLSERAKKLGIKQFNAFSRSPSPMKGKESTFSSNQTGSRESKEWTIDGRVVFDMYQVILSNHKLSSYTLNNVANHFLGLQKEDVHHSEITNLQNGSPSDRKRLAVYCCKDAELPLKLMENQMALVNYVEMARVTGVPLSFLLTRGQGIKVVSQILRKARVHGYLMPTLKPSGVDEGFAGAIVITPKTGFYELPIFTLDFASLYPSIMLAHNLCHTTFLPPGVDPPPPVEGVESYETTPAGHRFVTKSVKKGLLTLILEDLLAARSNAKNLMGATKDPSKKQVYNGRQLALKISANSVYGFTGQANGQLPMLQISASVTAYGRDMIMLTKETVEAEFSIKNGYEHDAEVIYGDTDSVMVCSGVKTVAEAIELGKKGAVLVTSKFPKPIKLEFEKVYYPWLLMAKKKYAGLWWTKPHKWDKIDAKGIESVRRDNCGMVRYVVSNVIEKILVQRDTAGAVDFCKGIISEICQNKIDLAQLIITKSYSRDAEDYKSPQAHVVLAQKMKQRNPATAPVVGDRIPYVIVKGEKDAKMFTKAEHPLYVLEHDIPIDSQYYIEQLISPLCRIFDPIMHDPKTVFTTGEHTRTLVIPRAKTSSGGLGKFLVVRDTCLGCRASLKNGEKTVCFDCYPDLGEIYLTYLAKQREKEMEFQRLWTHCQTCKGSVMEEIHCAANDCAIFYKRTKVFKELQEAQKNLTKFDLSW